MPRPVAEFVLSQSDKAALQGWLRKGTTSNNRLAQRARIPPKEISTRLGTPVASIFRWRTHYQERSLARLTDLPRPASPSFSTATI